MKILVTGGNGEFCKHLVEQGKEHSFLTPTKSELDVRSYWGIDQYFYRYNTNFDYVIQMDADLSHDPSDILKFLDKINAFDVVIGSRYKTGVNVVNWPLSRLFLSYMANIYARIFTGMKIYDLTSGFKCIKIDVLKNIDIDSIKSEGYSFQIEVNFLSWTKKYKIHEVPIIFHDRTVGESKMSKKIIFEAIIRVPMFRVKKILGF